MTQNSANRYKYLKAEGARTQGVITSKEEIFIAEDPGYAIEVAFVVEEINYSLRSQSAIHWPDNDTWQKYRAQQDVGKMVTVVYDPTRLKSTHLTINDYFHVFILEFPDWC